MQGNWALLYNANIIPLPYIHVLSKHVVKASATLAGQTYEATWAGPMRPGPDP